MRAVVAALVAALTCSAASAPAVAQDAAAAPASAPASSTGLYITIRPSLGGLEDLELSRPGGTDELQMTGGFGMAGSVGYRFSSVFRADLELAFRSHAIDELRVAGGPDLGIDGTVSSGALLASAYVDIPTGTRFTPYVGAGAGIGYVSLDSDDPSVIEDESDAVFAYQAAVGGQWRLSPLLSLFGGYRLFATSDPDLGTKTEYRTHNVDAGLRFDF